MFVTPAYAQDVAPANGDTHGASGEMHTETGVAHGEHGTGVFPPFDQSTYPSQLLWLVITFGLFFLVIQKVIVPRIGGILEHRHDRIAQDLDEASRMKAEADAAVETYEKELAEARTKAGAIADAAREAAKVKANADRASIEAELSEKIAAAEARISEIKARAFSEVGAIAEETAASVVDRLIGAKASAEDVKSAVAASKVGA